MSTSANERDPLLPRLPYVDAGKKPKFSWLLPVLLMASISRGIFMFARFENHQKTFCPYSAYPCGYFSIWLELPSLTVMIQIWGVWASFLVSFMTVGRWSDLGDRRGRKFPLLLSVTGSVLINLIYLIVSNAGPSQDDARDLISIGLILEGLFGGFATYNGAVHAYAWDVASTPVSRLVLFGIIQGLSFVGFILGSAIGRATDYNISYILSFSIALLNLVFVYFILPESLDQPDAARPPHSSIFVSIFSPITIMFSGAGSSKYLPFLGLAFFMYSLTQAMQTTLLRFTLWSQYLRGLPRWLVLVTPRILELLTLLCILPCLAHFWKRKHGTTEHAALHLSGFASRNSILLATVSSTVILVFCMPENANVLYAIFAPLYSFSVVAGPALYALGGAYFVALGRGNQIGSLFGAFAVWRELALYLSYTMYGPGSSSIFWLTAFFLILSLLFLLPDAPAVENAEEVGVAQHDTGAPVEA
ncbi:hypothetical protein R3P38DRAFT_2838701 [Favolaschia claudopus]|uniref:MFS general substrate transporter n=1 Tax=Favolaschia claudopus TaxID=2862362 RepID=A0AAW0E7T3_9AGAR